MKEQRKKAAKRWIAICMAGIMAVSSLSLIPAQKVEAGISTWVTKKVVTHVESALVKGLDKASNEMQGNNVLINVAETILKNENSMKYAIAETQELCKEILAELDKVDDTLNLVVSQNDQIITLILQDDVKALADPMNTFEIRYKGAADTYKNYLEASMACAEDPTDEGNQKALRTALEELERFYKDARGIDVDASSHTYRFMEDIEEYVGYVSPYELSKTYQTEEQWQPKKMGTKTYLEAVQAVTEQKSASQVQMYEQLSSNLNYAIVPMYYYLQAYQIYTLMYVNDINEDTSLSRVKKTEKIDMAWKDFEVAQVYVENAVNQMSAGVDKILSSYMRPYDVDNVEITMSYEEKRTVSAPFLAGGTSSKTYEASANKTSPTMMGSLLKLRDGSLYVIREDGSGNADLTLGDMMCKADSMDALFWEDTEYGISGDYLNLLEATGKWKGVKALKSADDLSAIVGNNPAYTQYKGESGKETGNLSGYLRDVEKLQHVFTKDSSEIIYGITSVYRSTASATNYGGDFEVNFYDICSVDPQEPSKSDLTLNFEEDVAEHGDSMKNKPIGVIMKLMDSNNEIRSKLSIKGPSSGYGFYIEAANGEGNRVDNVSPSYYFTDSTYVAGEPIEIKVKASEGKQIKSARMYYVNGNGDEVTIENFIDPDDDDNILESMEPDGDGFYTIASMAMPYRDVTLEINTEDKKNDTTHQVQLQQPENAGDIQIVQFDGIPGVDNQEYEAGDKVTINVWPDNEAAGKNETKDYYEADGIVIKDSSGNVLTDVEVVENLSGDAKLTKDVKTYQFTMPDQNIVVGTNLVKGYIVSTSSHNADGGKDSGGTLKFSDSDGNIWENAGSTLVYAAGKRVYIKSVPDKQYYLAGIKVLGTDTRKEIETREEQDGISFVMPKTDATVDGTFKEMTDGEYNVKVDIEKENGANATVILDGNNTTSGVYSEGDKVSIQVQPEDGCSMESYSITTADKDEKIESQCATELGDTVSKVITFTMPDVNVNVSIQVDRSAAYQGTIEIGEGLTGSVYEEIDGKQETLFSDIINGTMTFGAKVGHSYTLQVKADNDQIVPSAIYTAGNTKETLSGNSQEKLTYTYTLPSINSDFTVKVTDAGNTTPDDNQEYDYYIPNYEILCMYRDLINSDEAFRSCSYLVTEDIVVPDDAEPFEPIHEFAGRFDGGGHKIKGLQLANCNSEQGFIINLQKGTVENLELEDVTSTGGSGGMLVNTMQSKTIVNNCKVTGDSEIKGYGTLGGMVKMITKDADIYNCGYEGRITLINNPGESENKTVDDNAGGIAGDTQGDVYNSYFTGKFYSEDNGGGGWDRICGITGSTIAGGEVWNSYVGDDILDESVLNIQRTSRYSVSPVGTNYGNYYYISNETLAQWNEWKNQQLIYVSDDYKIFQKPLATMKSSSFVDTLNDYCSYHTDLPLLMTWTRDDNVNQGYPYFEKPDAEKMYAVKAGAIAGQTTLKANGATLEEKVSSYNFPRGSKIKLEGTTELSVVQLAAKTTTGKTLINGQCKPDENGTFQASFTMPEEDVEVSVTEANPYAGDVDVKAEVIPDKKAQAALQDKDGNALDKASVEDTVYVKVDDIAKGYGVVGFRLQSDGSSKIYKTFTDVAALRQEDGRYAVDIKGGNPEEGVIIYVELQQGVYSINTKVMPENTGTITCEHATAQKGETIEYTVSVPNGYYCGSLQLVQDNGTILQKLNPEAGKGTFIMPSENVTIEGTFAEKTYQVTTKDSADMTISVQDSAGNSIGYARETDVVTVHYKKNPWSADQNIFVYQADEYKAGNAQPIMSWTAHGGSDSTDTPLTFEMPAANVIIVGKEYDTSYKIDAETDGKGELYVQGVGANQKETAKQGERIFVSAYAKTGWSLDLENSHIYDAQGNVAEINQTQYKQYATFAMPAENLKVKGVFTQNEYAVTVEQPKAGTISVTDADGNEVDLNKVHYEDQLKIKVTGSSMKNVHYTQTGVADGQISNIPLDENGEAIFSMPNMSITLSEGSKMNQDEDGTYLISSFEDLKQAVEIVKEKPAANFKLMNTIYGNGGTMTESIGSADNPYNGTFDGQGYYIYRFDIKSSDGNAALFDTIGAQGSVKNFGAFYQNIEGEKAAGLAIVNYGLIDECISGSNLSGMFNDRLTDERKNLSETTTFIKGTSMAGGVVVENKGMIRNTANYANATASASDGIVGGIAVVNSGTIENCMSIGALSTKENGIAGGIVGKLDKNGSIQIAYSAQTAIKGGTTGAVFGTKEESAGAVKNTYYLDSLSGNEEQGTAKTKAEMQSNSFKEELNTLVAGNEELCNWTWNSTKNQGYPRILSSLVTEVELVNASRGVTVKGMMHKDTKLQLNELDKKNDIYQAFKKYAQKTDKQVLYSAEPMLVYADGQPAPYEGNLNVKLDLSKYRGKGYKVLVYRNNQIEELEIDKQMIASKDVEEMVPFAVLAEKSEITKAVEHIKNTVKTGDNSSLLLLFGIVVVAGSVAGGVIYWRKKKAKK